jgi:hypothetical protein
LDLTAVQGAIYLEDDLVYLASEIAAGDTFDIQYTIPVNNITFKAVYSDLVYESLEYNDQDYPLIIPNSIGYTVFDIIMIGGGGGGGSSAGLTGGQTGGGGGGGGACIAGRHELSTLKNIHNIESENTLTKGIGGTNVSTNGTTGNTLNLNHTFSGSDQYFVNIQVNGGGGGQSFNDGFQGGTAGLAVFNNPINGNFGQLYKSNGGGGTVGLQSLTIDSGGGDGGNSGIQGFSNVDGSNGVGNDEIDGRGTTFVGGRNPNGKTYGGGGAGRHVKSGSGSAPGIDGGNSYWKVVLKKLNITPRVFHFVYNDFLDGTAVGYGTSTILPTTKITITFEAPAQQDTDDINLLISSSEITNKNEILSFKKDGVEKRFEPGNLYEDSPGVPVCFFSGVRKSFVFTVVFLKEISTITLVST